MMDWLTQDEEKVIALFDAGRYAEFFSAIHCAENSWIVRFYDGLSLLRGYGRPKDRINAIETFRGCIAKIEESAANENPWAENCMGILTSESDESVVHQDEQASVDWLLRSAQHGLARAQFSMGMSYLEGRGTEKNIGKAIEWLNRAGEQGYARALLNLGKIHTEGGLVPKNETLACDCYRRAAEQGNRLAQYRFGQCCLLGRGVGKDGSLALQWIEKAAFQGLPEANYLLGRMYDAGDEVTRDVIKSLSYYQLSAESGCDEAQRMLGDKCKLLGDDDAAVRWWRKSAENGNFDAMLSLGRYYFSRKPVLADEALSWYDRILAEFEGGEDEIVVEAFGCLLAHDSNANEEMKEAWARKCIQFLSDPGEALSEASVKIANQNKGNVFWVEYWLNRASSLGNAEAMLQLAESLLEKNGSDSRADELFLQAAQCGRIDGVVKVAKKYLDDIGIDLFLGLSRPLSGKIKERIERALRWQMRLYEVAVADSARFDALRNIARLIAESDLLERRDVHVWFDRYVAIVSKMGAGNVDSIFVHGLKLLGRMSEHGTSVWLEYASEMADAESTFELAEHKRISKAYQDAIPWYERALKLGKKDAVLKLAEIYGEKFTGLYSREKELSYYAMGVELGLPAAIWHMYCDVELMPDWCDEEACEQWERNRREYKERVIKMANDGNVDAMYLLGRSSGVHVGVDEGLQYLIAAAERGHVPSVSNLVLQYKILGNREKYEYWKGKEMALNGAALDNTRMTHGENTDGRVAGKVEHCTE